MLLNPKVSFAEFRELPYKQLIKICRGMKSTSKKIGIIDVAFDVEEVKPGLFHVRVEWVNKS